MEFSLKEIFSVDKASSYTSVKLNSRYIIYMHSIIETNKLSAEYLDLEEQDVSGSMTIDVPGIKTNIRNITCILEDSQSRLFSCAVLNNDEKFYVLQLQFDQNVKKINLLTYMTFFKFKFFIGGSISLSKNYVAITGKDFSGRKRQVLVYRRQAKDTERVLTHKQNGKRRVLQKSLTPEHPYLFYSVDLPMKHSEVPIENQQFFLFQKKVSSTDSDSKTETKIEDKLAIQTANESGMAKIYSIQKAQLTFKRMGYYEMQDMKKIELQFEGGKEKIKKGIFQIFFDIDSTNIDTQDKENWEGFWNFLKSLRWVGIVLGSIALLVFMVVGCYCIRRETLKGNLDD